MTGYQRQVLQYLRDLFEDGHDFNIKTTDEIASSLGTQPLYLYNHNTDAGPLYHLWRDGLIDRYGNSHEGFSWRAAGANLVWDWA